MKFPKKKTIVCFDIESTGLDTTKDSIIQISMAKFDSETYELIDTYNTYVRPEGSYQIGIGAYLKHGITPEKLNDKPTFSEIFDKVYAFMDDSDILGYNCISFDIKILSAEFARVGVKFDFMNRNIYDSFLEEKRRNGISLENTYKRYMGKTMEEDDLSAHNSMSDVIATVCVFKEQQKIQSYEGEDLITEDNVIANQQFGDNKALCFTMGKYSGVPVSYVAKNDKNYLQWAVSPKCSFSDNTKKFISSYLTTN